MTIGLINYNGLLRSRRCTKTFFVGCSKIAAFDMDGCLIVPKSGAKFPKDSNDWKLLSNQVRSKLNMLHNDGYKIVIFTNQAGVVRLLLTTILTNSVSL